MVSQYFSKEWYQSKTLWGIIVAAVSFALQESGVDVDVASVDTSLTELLQVAGMVYAAYGRIVSKSEIKK